jgi:hypothetical protein
MRRVLRIMEVLDSFLEDLGLEEPDKCIAYVVV